MKAKVSYQFYNPSGCKMWCVVHINQHEFIYDAFPSQREAQKYCEEINEL